MPCVCCRKWVWIAVAFVLFGSSVFPAWAAYSGPRLKFRLAHPCPPGHHTTQAFEKFRDLVAEKSGGAIRVQLFPNAILGSDRVMLESAQHGQLEMAVCSSPNMTHFSPQYMVFDLPYITRPDRQTQLYAAIERGELGRFFKQVANEIGLEPIMYAEYGYRHFVTVKTPVHAAGDLAGLKVRTTDSPVEAEVARALGMQPVPVVWGETYTALEQGTVDAEGNTFSFLVDAQHYNVVKYAVLSEHNFCMQILSANKEWWDALDPQVRQVVTEAAAEALRYQRKVLAPVAEEKARREFEAAGVVVQDLSPASLEDFRRLTRPVWDMFSDRLSKELVHLITSTQQD
ncbi:MAG: TRAP transporter substrate-binding protein [Bilophila sp.]